jgi:hypothetical protein
MVDLYAFAWLPDGLGLIGISGEGAPLSHARRFLWHDKRGLLPPNLRTIPRGCSRVIAAGRHRYVAETGRGHHSVSPLSVDICLHWIQATIVQQNNGSPISGAS